MDSLKNNIFVDTWNNSISSRDPSRFNFAIKYILHYFVSESSFRMHNGATKPILIRNIAVFINIAPHRNSQPLYTWVEAAHIFTEDSRQHWNHSMDKIDTCCSFLGLLVDNGIFGNKVGNISYVNTNLEDFLGRLFKSQFLLISYTQLFY
jgi:hypothetical protein